MNTGMQPSAMIRKDLASFPCMQAFHKGSTIDFIPLLIHKIKRPRLGTRLVNNGPNQVGGEF